MQLKLVKKDFADNFLSIIGKAVDIASIKLTKDGLYTICNKPDTSIILLAKYNKSVDDLENEIAQRELVLERRYLKKQSGGSQKVINLDNQN